MKKFLLFIGCSFSSIVFGQRLTYEGKEVDSVKIASVIGFAHFDSLGSYSVYSDELLIRFDSRGGRYETEAYYRREFHAALGTQVHSERRLSLTVRKRMTSKKLAKLLEALQQNDSVTFDALQIGQREWQQLTARKKVDRYLRKHEDAHDPRYIFRTPETLEDFYAGLQSKDTFGLFLEEHMPEDGDILRATDYSDFSMISIVTHDSVFTLSAENTVMRQPWEKDGMVRERLYNMEINRSLLDILPKRFYRRETFTNAYAISELYMDWYLRRKKLLY